MKIVLFTLATVFAVFRPATALATQTYTEAYDHYTVTYPNAPWQVEGAEMSGDPVIIRNFGAAQYSPGGELPQGMGFAEIRVIMQFPVDDPEAALRFDSRFGHDIFWSPVGPRVAYSADIPASGVNRVVIVAKRQANKCFKVRLEYRYGDPRGVDFEQIVDSVAASINVTAP